MQCSRQNLISIVERASTISERLGPKFTFDDQTDQALINQRLKKWCEAVTKGNQQKFEKRLAWDNLTIQKICGALGTVRLVDDRRLPDWAETLAEVLQAASPEILEESHLHRYPYLDAEKPLPFEEVLIPFVEVAKKRLSSQASADYQQLSKSAQTQLERSLLEKLAGLCAFALELEFSIFRSYHDSPLSRFIGQLQTDPPRQQYTTFIKSLLNDGLLAFLQEYSVLARLTAIAVDFWVDATTEFLQRLASDLQDIQQTFQAGESNLGQIIAIEPALSDSHNQGRYVIALTFASGLKLIYKPKDLGIEAAYFELLDWCNRQGVPLPFKIIKVLN
ncbi:MAG: DUF4135 domain-containing protein, partial [Coleofasciculus sp. Co-bin14]|nr:DUF4135 domain-containing protein [Coleofasciculus sp. Co-bin14]